MELILILFLPAIVILLVKVVTRRNRMRDLKRKWRRGLENGWDFEKFVADLLRKSGYEAFATKGSHDFGADVIVRKRQEVIVLQAKYLSTPPTSSVLDEALAAAIVYGAREIGLITNMPITDAIKDYARKIEQNTFVKRVILIGKSELEKLLNGERLI